MRALQSGTAKLFLGVCLVGIIVISSCEKHIDPTVPADRSNSEEWDRVFVDASRVFQIGEVKTLVFENPYDANRCVLIKGGTTLDSADIIYEKLRNKQIPETAAKQLSRQARGEGTDLFFLKDDTIVGSIRLWSVLPQDEIYYIDVGKQVTFSIQLVPQLAEWINDPAFLKKPEIGKDYLTNPERPKPIEILGVE